MISIGAEIRGLPAPGDPTAAAAALSAEGANLAEMFGAIIAGMSLEAATEQPITPQIEGEAPAPAPEASAAATVVQLLALTVKQQAKALAEGEAEEPQAEESAEGQTPSAAETNTLPQIAPTASPVAQPVPQATPAVPQRAAAADGPKVEARPVKQQLPELPRPAPLVQIEEAPKPKLEAKAPVALAIGELMQAARQLALPQTRRSGSEPTVRSDDGIPKNFGQEVRQVVHAAISSMHAQAQPTPHSLEVARPTETLLEPLSLEPQMDSAEFAIERQLDVSAEGEWLDSLTRDIARTAGEGGTLRFKLNPENLGTLRVEITPQASGAAVRLTADTDAARTIIADAQPRLVAEAKANGVRISETHVDLGSQPQSGDPRRQQAQFEEAPVRTARFLRGQEESDGKPTRSQSERYA